MPEELRERIRELTRRAGLGELDPRVTLAAAALGVFAVLVAAWFWWPRGPSDASPVLVAQTNESSSESSTASFEPATSDEATAQLLFVHVVGAVRRPGVYRLPEGSRTADAVDAAGGAMPDAVLAALNLARPLADGEQVLVPTEDEVAAQPGAGAVAGRGASAGAPGASGAPVDLNTADAELLDTLPGVGPSTAEKIVADREANGPFGSVEDLGRVSGIGPKKLEQLRELVCVR